MLDFSILCLNCDRFVIETIGASFHSNDPSSNHKIYLDFFFYNQSTAQDLADSLDKIEEARKLEYISCQFPLEGYIGNLLREKYTLVARPNRKVKIAVFSRPSIHPRQLESYRNRLSFQYADTRIKFSDSRYQAKFVAAIKPMAEITETNQNLIDSTAIAYRIAFLYYRDRNESNGIWTF